MQRQHWLDYLCESHCAIARDLLAEPLIDDEVVVAGYIRSGQQNRDPTFSVLAVQRFAQKGRCPDFFLRALLGLAAGGCIDAGVDGMAGVGKDA